jgi:hypothetical protein
MNRKFWIKLLFVAIIFNSCQSPTEKMPQKEDVKTTKPLQIDGVYEMSSDVEMKFKKAAGLVIIQKQQVIFKNGIGYYGEIGFWNKRLVSSENIQPGKVFLKNIKKITPIKYEGCFYPLRESDCVNVSLLVEGNNLKMTAPPFGVVGISQTYVFEFISSDIKN